MEISHSIAQIIKYEGDNSTLAWKHPIEDFNLSTQLIVHESQEAIFFLNGQALDLFGSGRHTLETQNIPIIRKLLSLPTGGQTPFHCEVYFVNKTINLEMKWGTNSKIQVLDPKFGIILHAGASGGLGIQIDDSRKFLVKLVGTLHDFSHATIQNYFREIITTRVKTYLTNVMSQVSFITVNSQLDDISQALQQNLSNDLAEFGVKLMKFMVSTIQLNEKDYELVQSALAEASVVGIAARAEKGRMDTLGYNWADQERMEIAKKFATNPGQANNVGGIVAQIPMALAFGHMMRDTVTPLMGDLFSADQKQPKYEEKTVSQYCPGCGKKLDIGAAFCSGCGKRQSIQIKCPNCSKILSEDAIFCPKCGKKREGN